MGLCMFTVWYLITILWLGSLASLIQRSREDSRTHCLLWQATRNQPCRSSSDSANNSCELFSSFNFISLSHQQVSKKISAHFTHFTAYSTNSESIVLLGDTDTTPTSQPNIIPALQNRSIISVVMGDYHNAALTADGKLLTWGQYSNGALGLGDPFELEPGSPGAFATAAQRALARDRGRGSPQAVSIPTEVRFDHARKKPRDRFCFAATAAGWHTGALVIDLEVCLFCFGTNNPLIYDILFLSWKPDEEDDRWNASDGGWVMGKSFLEEVINKYVNINLTFVYILF